MKKGVVCIMPELTPKVGTRTNVKTRLETLYYFVYEMTQSFGADDSALDSITKGILQRRIINEIIIKYLNASNVVVGPVSIKIDWDKHELLASTDYGATFTLDANKSVRAQVSEVSDIIIDHVNNMRSSLGIRRIKTSFSYLPEIANDKQKYEEAQTYLGHHIPPHEDVSIQKNFIKSMTWLCDKLNEVKITIEHSK